MRTMTRYKSEEFVKLLPERQSERFAKFADSIDIFISYPSNRRGNVSNFTVVIIHGKLTGEYCCGVSKRNADCDDYNPSIGLRIAANRAWKDFIDLNPGYGRAHNKRDRQLDRIISRTRPLLDDVLDLVGPWRSPIIYAPKGGAHATKKD
jgi:hypothetical protein